MSEKESRRRWGEGVDRAQTTSRLKDCGKDMQFILRGMEKAVEDFMHWSKV